MAWIRITNKSFPSFDQADRERSALLPHLATDHGGADNVKVRIRRRSGDRYEVIAWRRDEATSTESSVTTKGAPTTQPTHQPSKRTKRSFAALAAMITIAGASTGGN